MALPAELNGYPGPRHILELADALKLSQDQHTQIQTIFEMMEKEAIAAGQQLIAAEAALDQIFRDGKATEADLRGAIFAAAQARADLRFVHLSQHLKTVIILRPQQIETYNELRGYASADPCDAVPEGHNPTMWRKHNGCDP